jgi:hypothetical protein
VKYTVLAGAMPSELVHHVLLVRGSRGLDPRPNSYGAKGTAGDADLVDKMPWVALSASPDRQPAPHFEKLASHLELQAGLPARRQPGFSAPDQKHRNRSRCTNRACLTRQTDDAGENDGEIQFGERTHIQCLH